MARTERFLQAALQAVPTGVGRTHRLARGRTVLATVVSLGALVASAPAAWATFPGQNGKIAFVRMVDGRQMDIFTMSPDGSDVIRLTHDAAFDSEPAWSPDGQRIAFNSDRDGDPEIYVMEANGSNVRQLTFNHGPLSSDFHPEWTSDGRIVFNSNRDGDFDLYIINPNGKHLKQLTNHPATDWLSAPSPNTDEVAFASNRDGDSEIYVMNLDGSNVRQLTFNLSLDALPSWSPDGSKIAFVSERDYVVTAPNPLGPPSKGDIYVMDANGADQRRLTATEQSEIVPAWSPQGDRIAFTRCVMLVVPRDCSILTMNPDGTGGEVKLAGNAFQPDWQAV